MLPTIGSKIYLDAEENLLDSDGRAPVLLLIQDGEAHLSRGKWVYNLLRKNRHTVPLG